MAEITKTTNITLFSIQLVSGSSVVIGTPVDVGAKLGGTIFVHFARPTSSAAGAGMNIRIEASPKDSGDGHWYPLRIYTTGFAAAADEAVSGTENAGETVIGVASTTGLAVGDIVFFYNSGTIGQSEWHRVKAFSTNASITLEDAIVYAQTGNTIYDQGEMFVNQFDFTGIKRIRVVADGASHTQNAVVEVYMITGDSIG